MSFPAGDLSATRQSNWVAVDDMTVWGVSIHTLATGTPVGTYSFEGSNDANVIRKELVAGTLPASTAAKKFVIPSALVNGDSLTLTGVAANSYVAFSAGLPQYIRVIYTRTSGGTAGVPTLITSGLRSAT